MARISSLRNTALLIVGDLVAYTFSLVMTLVVRYGAIPGRYLLFLNFPPFLILFAVSIIVNFSAGLYDKQLAFVRRRTRGLIVRSQIVSAILGVLFFYFAPVAITPKANLFIYFVISTLCLFLWRMVMLPVMSVSKKQTAILVGAGNDIQDIFDEINGSARYGIVFKDRVEPSKSASETTAAITAAVKSSGASMIVADLHDKTVEAAMSFLYSLIFSGVQVVDGSRLYETLFDRIPLSMVGERWLVENSSAALGNRRVYDTLKRAMDIIISSVLGAISLVAYPFVYAAVKLDDGGPIFITQERVGKNGRTIRIVKFRSMSGDDHGDYGADGVTKNKVTRVGRFLRASRIDELPQLWNVLLGDLSLIGPRPELPSLSGIYRKEIPYYNVRHLVTPGLSGWAQIYHEAHPHHAVATEETRDKLSYDLYYIRNRSLILDLKIALRTLQVLLRKTGK
ncbi:MAG: exopolysaccharide biosynthesis polyprenyl glycosylphosphotransferase [Minisyncoccia bacterium]|jgi:exopolysaccharide biosynthesis polyprenyl glycosylphosphotransferase